MWRVVERGRAGARFRERERTTSITHGFIKLV